MSSYHLELLESSKNYLNVFSRAHMSYINQIFGDQTVRIIIQEIWLNPGSLIVEDGGPAFMDSNHHVYMTESDTKACSVEIGYQNLNVDINDTLCQSYSLMSYLNIPFDKTPSITASPATKKERQMTMINMYRTILENKQFINAFSNEIVFEDNDDLWLDSVNHKKTFFMIKKFKNAAPIIKNIHRVLDIWEDYGWSYFVNNGKLMSA
jgi:hypothetical protein